MGLFHSNNTDMTDLIYTFVIITHLIPKYMPADLGNI